MSVWIFKKCSKILQNVDLNLIEILVYAMLSLFFVKYVEILIVETFIRGQEQPKGMKLFNNFMVQGNNLKRSIKTIPPCRKVIAEKPSAISTNLPPESFRAFRILISTQTNEFSSIFSTKHKIYESKKVFNMKYTHRNQPVRVEIEILKAQKFLAEKI